MAKVVVIQHHRVETVGPEFGQTPLSGRKQRLTNSLSAAPRVHGEPIEMSSPTVPPGDDRPDEPPLVLGHEKSFWVALQQSRDNCSIVGWPAGVLRGMTP